MYEVIRCYNGRLFRAADHFERLRRSMRELRIAPPGETDFDRLAEELLHENRLANADATLYIQITRGVAPRKHAFPTADTPPTVYAAAAPFHLPREKLERGIKAILAPDIRWARCDIKSISLLPNVLASQQAAEQGAGEALFVRDGAVTEGTHTNFCAVFDGQLLTYPKTHYVLPGITREVVLGLCGELGIPFREFPVLEKELPRADELMVLGTVSEVLPVVQVNHWTVGDGKPGPITRKLQRAFGELAY